MTLLRMFLIQTKAHFVWYFRRDGEMMFWTLAMPVFFLVLFSFAFSSGPNTGSCATAMTVSMPRPSSADAATASVGPRPRGSSLMGPGSSSAVAQRRPGVSHPPAGLAVRYSETRRRARVTSMPSSCGHVN